MKKLSARRRHPLAAVVVLLLALAATGGLYAAFAPASKAQADETAQSLAIEEGKKLYSVGCASCHGTGGQGTTDGPSLVGVGAAAVDFQVGTGRMPAQQPGAQVPKKKVIYSQAEIDQLAAYIASLGAGPIVADREPVRPRGRGHRQGRRAVPHQLRAVPQLHRQGRRADQRQVRARPSRASTRSTSTRPCRPARRTCRPSPTPRCRRRTRRTSSRTSTRSTATTSESPGGLELGGLGPVSEGLFAWIFGLGALIAVAVWVAARTAKAKKS